MRTALTDLAINSKELTFRLLRAIAISLDQETHEFHDILKKNWKDNIIPYVVLSSATLPKEYELTEFIMTYNNCQHPSICQFVYSLSHDVSYLKMF